MCVPIHTLYVACDDKMGHSLLFNPHPPFFSARHLAVKVNLVGSLDFQVYYGKDACTHVFLEHLLILTLCRGLQYLSLGCRPFIDR